MHADGLPVPRRYWAMARHCAGDCDVGARQHASPTWRCPPSRATSAQAPAASIWVINAYQLAILVLLLPLAALGEIVGYRRVSQTGLALFTLASLGLRVRPDAC